MTTLSTSGSGEVLLTLNSADENRVLATLRRWPYWLRVDIERDPADSDRCLAVTLVADKIYEATLREILKRSFGMTFPAEGGSTALPPAAPPTSRRRSR